jgi:hypothetical protein
VIPTTTTTDDAMLHPRSDLTHSEQLGWVQAGSINTLAMPNAAALKAMES